MAVDLDSYDISVIGRKKVKHLEYITEKIAGSTEDWLDAIEALGVRAVYYNGVHRAFLGKHIRGGTNASVAYFNTREACVDWCNRVNKQFGPFDG